MSILQLISWLVGSAAVGLGVFLIFSGWLSDWLAGNRRQPRCRKCWYPMTVPGQLVCPECGWNAPDEAAKHRSRRVRSRIVLGVLILLLGASASLWSMVTMPGAVSGLPLRVRFLTHRYLHTEPWLFSNVRPDNQKPEDRAAMLLAAMDEVRDAKYVASGCQGALYYLMQLQSVEPEWLPCWGEIIEHGDPSTLQQFANTVIAHPGLRLGAGAVPPALRQAAVRLEDPTLVSGGAPIAAMLRAEDDARAQVLRALNSTNNNDHLLEELLSGGPASVATVIDVWMNLPPDQQERAAYALSNAINTNVKYTHWTSTPTLIGKALDPLIAPALSLWAQASPPNGNGVTSLLTALSEYADQSTLADAMTRTVKGADATACSHMSGACAYLKIPSVSIEFWAPFVSEWFNKLEQEDTAEAANNVLIRLPYSIKPLILPHAKRALKSPHPWTRYYALYLYQRSIWEINPLPTEPLEAIAHDPSELQSVRMQALFLLDELNGARSRPAKPWEVHLDP